MDSVHDLNRSVGVLILQPVKDELHVRYTTMTRSGLADEWEED